MKKGIQFFCVLFSVTAVLSSCNKSSNDTSFTSSIAPYGIVTSIGSGNFTIKDTTGINITIDIVSGTTYQYTVARTLSAAVVGGYIAGSGSVSKDQLNAVNLAFVPTPPSFVVSQLSEVQTSPTGTIYFGQITTIQNGIITINWNGVTKTINTTNATNITLTVTSDFQAIAVGDTVEVNGPAISSTEYEGHQINIGLTPAVVGQFD